MFNLEKIMRKAANDIQEKVTELTTEVLGETAGENVSKGITAVRNVMDSVQNYTDQQHRKQPNIPTTGPTGGPDTRVLRYTPLCEQTVDMDACEPGDHLFRDGDSIAGQYYTHHAIYIGRGDVIHYAEAGDGVRVHVASFEEFANGHPVKRYTEQRSPLLYTPEEAVRRAKSRLGESDYNLAINNCENFVRWCRAGGEHF